MRLMIGLRATTMELIIIANDRNMKYTILTLSLLFSFSLDAQHVMMGSGDGPPTAPPASATDFRIVVNTANSGVSLSDQFQFTGAVGDYDVDVYDQTGTTLIESHTGLSNAATITIAAGAGIYELRVHPAVVNGFNLIAFASGGDKDKLIEIRNWGSNVFWSSFINAFNGCQNLTTVSSITPASSSSVTSAFRMFAGCTSLVSADLTGLDMSSVTSIGVMFAVCNNSPNVDITGWNTTSLTSVRQFLSSASGISINLNEIDFSNVTDFYRFARGNKDLSNVTGIENINISSATNLSGFFNASSVSTSVYDQLLINWEGLIPPTGLTFDGGSSTYTLGSAAETARTSLINTYGWTITDGGGI